MLVDVGDHWGAEAALTIARWAMPDDPVLSADLERLNRLMTASGSN